MKKKKAPTADIDIPEVVETINDVPNVEIPDNHYILPRERCKQNLKPQRKQKERYRKNAVKKAIQFLNKKDAVELLREPKVKNLKPKAKQPKPIEVSDVSGTEIIQYAEPYRDTFTKKDERYRKKAKLKTIQTLIKKKNIDNALLKNATGTIDNDDVDIDFKVTAPNQNDGGSDDDDVAFVKYVPPPPKNPPPLINPRDRCLQKLKQIREQKKNIEERLRKKL